MEPNKDEVDARSQYQDLSKYIRTAAEQFRAIISSNTSNSRYATTNVEDVKLGTTEDEEAATTKDYSTVDMKVATTDPEGLGSTEPEDLGTIDDMKVATTDDMKVATTESKEFTTKPEEVATETKGGVAIEAITTNETPARLVISKPFDFVGHRNKLSDSANVITPPSSTMDVSIVETAKILHQADKKKKKKKKKEEDGGAKKKRALDDSEGGGEKKKASKKGKKDAPVLGEGGKKKKQQSLSSFFGGSMNWVCMYISRVNWLWLVYLSSMFVSFAVGFEKCDRAITWLQWWE